MENKFTVNITNSCKGIAMCFMIFHHLFYNIADSNVTVYNAEFAQNIGVLSKVCVAIFLILSGYGLEQSNRTEFNILNFYKKRLSKIYISYWFAITLSIIIGIIFFKDKFSEIIQGNGWLKIAYSYTGIQFITGYQGFNGSWWYITLTIILYILFPLIRELIKKYNLMFLLLSSLMLFPGLFNYNILNIKWIAFWFFPFILGVFLSYNNTLEDIIKISNDKKFNYINMILFLFLFAIISKERLRLGMSYEGYALDTVYALIVIIINYMYLSKISMVNDILVYIGKYSMDMFLIHGFITTIYTAPFIYSFKIPLVIFLVTLILSLIIAILMSKIKKSLKIA